jgi:hypothetical protein
VRVGGRVGDGPAVCVRVGVRVKTVPTGVRVRVGPGVRVGVGEKRGVGVTVETTAPPQAPVQPGLRASPFNALLPRVLTVLTTT